MSVTNSWTIMHMLHLSLGRVVSYCYDFFKSHNQIATRSVWGTRNSRLHHKQSHHWGKESQFITPVITCIKMSEVSYTDNLIEHKQLWFLSSLQHEIKTKSPEQKVVCPFNTTTYGHIGLMLQLTHCDITNQKICTQRNNSGMSAVLK
jgi:hypothetical protein